jgi:hypothetical protein
MSQQNTPPQPYAGANTPVHRPGLVTFAAVMLLLLFGLYATYAILELVQGTWMLLNTTNVPGGRLWIWGLVDALFALVALYAAYDLLKGERLAGSSGWCCHPQCGSLALLLAPCPDRGRGVHCDRHSHHLWAGGPRGILPCHRRHGCRPVVNRRGTHGRGLAQQIQIRPRSVSVCDVWLLAFSGQEWGNGNPLPSPVCASIALPHWRKESAHFIVQQRQKAMVACALH